MIIDLISYTAYKFAAIFIVVVGFGLKYWINRRAFNRRTFGASQVFSSYEAANITRLWEGIVRIISALLILGGILLFLLMRSTQPNKKKIDNKNISENHINSTFPEYSISYSRNFKMPVCNN